MNNPFAGSDIMIPDDFREHFDSFVQKKEGKSAQPIHQPFGRNIDMWFFAICLAVKKGLTPTTHAGKSYKAAEGVVLNADPWRPTALTLLAIGETGDVSIVDRPGEMLRIASGYAMAGLPELLTLLNEREGDTALDYLSESIEGMLRTKKAA
ncbi:MAG: hypothetical protein V4610_09115 [Pseudomonadota bacterium]|uniref:hypothetical protein n=1 Tax=Sphingomonas sp. 3P27F8 TaxID=2502213 RepID=UPI0010F6E77D|nr:hypothetical protein [Sphingomonas sp. 3P27F8]